MNRHQQYLTPQGMKKLEEELDPPSDTVRRREVVAKITASHDAGGVEDNAEYEEAKNELALVEARISEIENVLERAVVADKSMVEKGVIGFGSSVNVRDRRKRKTAVPDRRLGRGRAPRRQDIDRVPRRQGARRSQGWGRRGGRDPLRGSIRLTVTRVR